MRESNSQKDRVAIGLIGRISPIKGQDIFIKAANIVLNAYDSVEFKMIGDNKSIHYLEYKQYLRELIQKYNLGSRVEFLGYSNDIVKTLRELDIVVVPSTREPFGRVTIEAMASCIPVVATQNGGALDIITHDTGILFPVGDVQALSRAIFYLIENPTIRSQMGAAGRKRVENNFTIKHTLQKIYNLYDVILN